MNRATDGKHVWSRRCGWSPKKIARASTRFYGVHLRARVLQKIDKGLPPVFMVFSEEPESLKVFSVANAMRVRSFSVTGCGCGCGCGWCHRGRCEILPKGCGCGRFQLLVAFAVAVAFAVVLLKFWKGNGTVLWCSRKKQSAPLCFSS